MGIEEKFREYVSKWQEYCKKPEVNDKKDIAKYIKCDAYERLRKMGKPILPFIRYMYAGSDEQAFFSVLGWSCLIHDIVGDEYKVPNYLRGKVKQIRKFAVEFLDDYLGNDDLEGFINIKIPRKVISSHRVTFDVENKRYKVDGGKWKKIKRRRPRIIICDE